LARLWQDGSIDQGGWTTYGVDEMGPGAHETAYGVVVQSDGKLIVAGTASDANYLENYALLARFLPDGEIDRTFGGDGHVIFGFGATNSARAVALQPDGKIVAAGVFRNGSTQNFMVARFNADGSVDNSFAFVGQNLVDFAGGDDYANAVAIAPDGKIV